MRELCATENAGLSKAGDTYLSDICTLVADKVSLKEACSGTYISTESLLPNKQGRQLTSGLPSTGKVTRYRPGDILISNIRPYFKKIWYADCEGTCSGDVLAFRANSPELSPFLFFTLFADEYFAHVVAGSKGTKMPRGDKTQMMQYRVAVPTDANVSDFSKRAGVALEMIAANTRESSALSLLRDTLLPKLMSGEIEVGNVNT